MGHGGLRQFFTAQHAGNFTHPELAGNGFDLTGHAIVKRGFGHQKVVVGAGGDLGQVGHGQDLTVLAQFFHQAAHRLGHGAAHARIDFVKNQGLGFAQLAGGHRNGQRNARQLAP